MAGHSKFKNIQFRKGAQDKKRAKLFSKLAREITTAAKIVVAYPFKPITKTLNTTSNFRKN